MALEIKTTFTDRASESQLILKRDFPEGPLQIIIIGAHDQQQSCSLDPAHFLEGLRSVYPDLLIQLPT